MKNKAKPHGKQEGRFPNGKPSEAPILAIDMPVLFEDEGQEEMGETEIHTACLEILHCGIEAHLAKQPGYRVFADLNWYYHATRRWAYVSPDVMVVMPKVGLPTWVRSYRSGPDHPPPVLVVEVLSRRSAQQQDLSKKLKIYADHGVQEYLLVDFTEEFLPERLLLKWRDDDGFWEDRQDADGGITSALGFRVIVEADGKPRVVNAATGKGYIRPEEANELVERERRRAEAAEHRLRAADEEITRLRRGAKKRKSSE